MCLERIKKHIKPITNFFNNPKTYCNMIGGAGTFLMEHMPKSTQRVGGCIYVFRNFRKVPMVLFCHKKERGGTPSNI